MTFIIALQTEDSIVVASDTRYFTLDEQGQIQRHATHVMCKSTMWEHGVFSGTGIHEISEQVLKHLVYSTDVTSLHGWLQHYCHQFYTTTTAQPLLEQLTVTRIIYSYMTDDRPQLQVVALDGVVDVETNGMRVYSYSADFTPIMTELMQLQSQIRARHFFIDDKQWIDYYLEHLQGIFKKMGSYDDWVSQDFHVYLQYGNEGRRYFGHVTNV